jgi:hypothetical protein
MSAMLLVFHSAAHVKILAGMGMRCADMDM